MFDTEFQKRSLALPGMVLPVLLQKRFHLTRQVGQIDVWVAQVPGLPILTRDDIAPIKGGSVSIVRQWLRAIHDGFFNVLESLYVFWIDWVDVREQQQR